MKLRHILWLAPLAFLGAFYLYPLSRIIELSLARSSGSIFSLLKETFVSAYLWRVIGFTFWQASISTLVTLCIGLPGAYYLGKYHFRGRELFRALTGVPFIMPTLVTAMAFDSLLGARGWLNMLLMMLFQLESPPIIFIHTFSAIVVAHVFYNTTIILRIVGDFWSRLDVRLSLAAQTLGANPLQAFRSVTLPLLAPAIGSASLLVFIFNFTSFGVILILGGVKFATLETEIYYQTTALFNLPTAALLSLLQLCCTLLFTLIYLHVNQHISTPLPMHSQTQHVKHKWIAFGVLGLLGTWLVLPLFSLFSRSFIRLGGHLPLNMVDFTLSYYLQLFTQTEQSIFYVSPLTVMLISLAYAMATVLLSLLFGLPAAWLLSTRDETPRMKTLQRSFDALLMLPLGTSAVTLGLGIIVSYNQPPFDLRASPILIPFVHTLVAFPFVVRSLVPALQSIQPRYRDAASLLGASPKQVLRYIDIPLMLRAILVASTFAFTISLGEFGATSILTRPEFPTIPIMIFRLLSRPGSLNYGQGLALSSILMLLCAGAMFIIERINIRSFKETSSES